MAEVEDHCSMSDTYIILREFPNYKNVPTCENKAMFDSKEMECSKITDICGKK